MKKALFVLALAAALIFTMTAAAFADHSPSFYIKWDAAGGYEGANAAVPSPHNGYAEGTQKCGVCHAVHRAAVNGIGWVNHDANATYGTPANPDPTQPDGMLPYPADAGGTNRATRQIYGPLDVKDYKDVDPSSSGVDFEWVAGDTQMLLQSSVAGACDYCHITTSIGGEQIYAGNVKYRVEAGSAEGGSDWEGGYAHNNACTACHAVHGAYSVTGSTPSGNVVFKGAAASKVLKGYAKSSTTWQSAVVYAGTSANLTGLFANPSLVQTSATLVAPNNVPLFASKADALAGTNVRSNVDTADAQVTAFCTFCHENYGYASEDLINPQNVNVTSSTVATQRGLAAMDPRYEGKGLFQGPWVYKSPADSTLYSARGSLASTSVPGLDGQIPVKNHPMKNAEASFVAAGDNFAGQAAFANSNTCRDCHDAGVEEQIGVMVQSWPHFTPGYFKFLTTADYLGGDMDNIDPELAATPVVASGDATGLADIQSVLDSATVIEEAQATADGACLKCHINGTNDAGIGKTF